MKTMLGTDVFLSGHKRVSGEKFALICNQSSFDSSFLPTLDSMILNNMKPDYVLAPEHGLYGFYQDMETFRDNIHPYHKIPVLSLYGENEKSLTINSRFLDGFTIIYDIQDIGSRYYTFMWTLFKVLTSVSGFSSRIIVLDRPNPIIPLKVNGPPIEPGFESFVGSYSIPIIYGLTIGEFALYIKDKLNLDIDLEIIPMKNYNRNSYYDDTGLPWGFPSPNMPTIEAAILYPGACLIEGTNLSEGRGTTRPFSLVGAPYIEPDALCEELKNYEFPGILYKPIYFRPMFNKHKGKICGGIEIAVFDRDKFNSVRFYLFLISIVLRLYPEFFKWRCNTYEYRDDIPAFDMLIGSDTVRKNLEKGEEVDIIIAEWTNYENKYFSEIKKIMLYR